MDYKFFAKYSRNVVNKWTDYDVRATPQLKKYNYRISSNIHLASNMRPPCNNCCIICIQIRITAAL